MASGCSGAPEPAEEVADVRVVADRLYDGKRFFEPGAMLIRDGRILAVGKTVDGRAEQEFDLGDATILPGFIDLHRHGASRRMASHGVTTARILASPTAAVERASTERWSRLTGIRVLVAGPIITVPGGYPIWAHGTEIAATVRTPQRAREVVRDLARRGAAVIKIAFDSDGGQWPMLTIAQVKAIVDEAHANDLRVTAHAFGVEEVRRAVAGGVDEFAHIPCGATDELIQRIADQKVAVVATLHVALLLKNGCGYVAERIVSRGGRLLYGSDFGTTGIPEGIDVQELRLLRDAGLAPEAVLSAATSMAGEQLGLAPLGTLVQGAPADVIAIRGDARDLPDGFSRPRLVIAGGRVIVSREP